MVFKRFVEVGRVVLVTYGEHRGKLGVIVDVVDQNRVLVDGPQTGLPRHTINFKSLALTPFQVKIQHGSRTGVVRKALEEKKLMEQWKSTLWYKKLCSRENRRKLGDFERFKLMIAKKKKAAMVNGQVKKLKSHS
ncbi:60S ribosomal protein L14 [Galdieria sulphuraria]|uniref:60S ribosomal protein L14e n=1 Tax=Galdieria sulphuraria TaxID=130081 RepID=M2WVW0_GALSU|nr:60S ribosomal protein L14e [Galdieria sulphuraria]EME28130.1 60S ribosomal protein L14e [Galdieria sulphuraria]GJD12054.1 60S ribosomal protein L14 [Galdieria sulphuraria]|eukprot:XP_005704650.1 60S ribosomal protein L14e [Galdieria sulphuraria]